MKSMRSIPTLVAGSVALFAACGIANAQDLGALKGMAGGMDLSSMASGSAGNAAGVIEYCMKNNYLSGDAASSVKDQLMGKIGGESGEKAADGSTDTASGAAALAKSAMGEGSKDKATDTAATGDIANADFADGAKGLLKTGDGKSMDLGKIGGMKKSVTEKACASVLEHAKSFL